MGQGKKDFGKTHGFKKGKGVDPRINRKGRPKSLPSLVELMRQCVGHEDPDKLTTSELGKVVAALMRQAKNGNVRAADVLFDRIFGRAVMKIQTSAEVPIEPQQPIINIIKTGTPPLQNDEKDVDKKT